ncbi:hypothetical protein N1851_013948 [Merluccius polli]|uniref:Uncharacterized protein n=1 Tax=Merluccius polli TaxID=89951 RepID=A0AA47MV65_MERPO|nr:hypothetical protein N1851_013948 [Merluccius polli]
MICSSPAVPGLLVRAGAEWIRGTCGLSAGIHCQLLAQTRQLLPGLAWQELANRTFILKDFFTSRGLDFLFVTGTWLSAATFSQNCVTPDPVCDDIEALSSQFLDTCQIAIDYAAPLNSRQRKVKSEPWLNETTRTARQECRRAERKWKKDKLEVSFQVLRDCWHCYQSSVKEAKRKIFL